VKGIEERLGRVEDRSEEGVVSPGFHSHFVESAFEELGAWWGPTSLGRCNLGSGLGACPTAGWHRDPWRSRSRPDWAMDSEFFGSVEITGLVFSFFDAFFSETQGSYATFPRRPAGCVCW